jgi:uncharacterized Ntn-hydrolase superfamily protein
MALAYEQTPGDLAFRMMAALEAAQSEGGDIRGMQSAALKIVPGDSSKPSWATDYDLRVDEHENPVQELARLVRLRHAQLLDEAGYQAFQSGERDRAFTLWSKARTEAPELEELAFWQAATLADKPADVAAAAAILRPAFATDLRRDFWLDLLRRLQSCGLLERPDAAEELIQALE